MKQRSSAQSRRRARHWWRGLVALGAALGAALGVAGSAAAFPHVVEPGETLARIAERFYGRVQLERVLVTANHLDRTGAKGLTPGQLLEIPALGYHRVQSGETWESLAASLLGDTRRAIFLADSNGEKPWIQPEVGRILAIPYNLAWITNGDESLATLAYRFLGSTKQAWALTQYNDLEKRTLARGEILLLPLTELPLTPDGQRAARLAAAALDEQAKGDTLRQQADARGVVSAMAADVRAGRYVAAVAKGGELLVRGELSTPLAAHVQQLLLESHVALEATPLARKACTELRKLEPDLVFDPIATSPKLVAACPPLPAAAQPATSQPTNTESPAQP
ncbi:MAG TPA: LysM domain-containing protein [Polyangiaceae bacterium]|nr:LysM domain-containing protein [Polyangiaceae bacterium]